jgi:hypothetical protein
VFPLLLPMAMLASGAGELFLPTRPLMISTLAHPSNATAEIRLSLDRATFHVAAGIQIIARIHGPMAIPPTDPGRTLIHVELIQPLLDRKGRTVLLPAGTELVGQVHLLRGEFRFVDFQSCLLPDGRNLGLPEDVFRLGPSPLLAIQDGYPATLTVARPLRLEAFGASQ